MKFDPPRPKSDDERILPLINVVFLLLIFFMLAGQLSAIDPFNTEPPRSLSEGETGQRELVIVLGPEGNLAFEGTPIDVEALKATLSARLQETPEIQVWLKADAQAEALDVLILLDTLTEAGVTKLKLLTLPANGQARSRS